MSQFNVLLENMTYEEPDFWPPLEWLRKTMTLEEIHASWAETANEFGLSGPAPSWLEKWNDFIDQKTDQDELWFFRSSEESWKSFAGAEGYAIVKNGKPVAYIGTARS